jgi:predicted RNA-binding protein with PUA-like domain
MRRHTQDDALKTAHATAKTTFALRELVGLASEVKNFWLVKQEPSSYSWSDFVAEGQTSWTGVRNYTARNNLRRMEKNDEVLFYHSGEDKAVVGIAKVIRTAYPDSTAKEGDWSTVDLAPVKPLRRPVTLREIKSHSPLKGIPLVRQSRLSVMPLAESEFREIAKMGARMASS